MIRDFGVWLVVLCCWLLAMHQDQQDAQEHRVQASAQHIFPHHLFDQDQ